ncbi:MAG: anti-sigma factor domain-containing protein [Ruthenibacterium sp.]
MKAVILEVKNNSVAALLDDGSFVRMKNAHYTVGQQIEVSRFTLSKPKLIARVSAFAACCLFACGLYLYQTPAYYVSVDVNPSVAYTLNTFDRVLGVSAANEDGAHILQTMDLKKLRYKSIDEAMSLTLAEITREGYFDNRSNGGIVIATSGNKTETAEKLAEHLKDIATVQCAKSNHIVSVSAMTASPAQADEAKLLGVTPGKLLLVKKLMTQQPAAKTRSMEEWLKKPVKDIINAFDSEDAPDADDENDSGDDAVRDTHDHAKDVAENVKENAENAAEDTADAAEDTADAAEDTADAAEDAADAAEDAADAAHRSCRKKAKCCQRYKTKAACGSIYSTRTIGTARAIRTAGTTGTTGTARTVLR